jgi:hypothetical protein
MAHATLLADARFVLEEDAQTPFRM